MPKKTFENLAQDKKDIIINAFLEEFTQHRYDDASLSQVVKKLGIAKGSVYQYFENKTDIYLYLKGICEQVKLKYIVGIKRDDHADFWGYFRALFEAGVQFDLKNPTESRFLYAISKNENSPSVKEFHNQWRDQALAMFEGMIQAEIDKGFFRTDVSVKTMSFFLISASVHIGDYMQIYYGTDFDKNFSDGGNVFARQKDLLMKAVDEFILLLKQAFNSHSLD